jgi:hypothetical protein
MLYRPNSSMTDGVSGTSGVHPTQRRQGTARPLNLIRTALALLPIAGALQPLRAHRMMQINQDSARQSGEY